MSDRDSSGMHRPPVKASASAAAPPAPGMASVDSALIRERFNFDWATSDPVEGLDTYWWWARSVRVDPNEVIADGDDGTLWRVPFSTDGVDAVTFGTPVRVAETYVDVDAPDGAAATAIVTRRRQRVAAAALAKPTKTARSSSEAAARAAAASTATTEETVMELSALRQALGLSEDTPDEEVLAAAAERLSESTTEETTEETTEPTEVSTDTTTPVPASASAVAIDPGTLEQLRADAAAGRQAREQQQRDDRDRTITAAIGEGRITRARRAHFEAAWNADPEGTRTLLTADPDKGGLAPGLVPVSEIGHAGGDNPNRSATDAQYDQVMAARGLKKS
jgi:hypothetical protein